MTDFMLLVGQAQAQSPVEMLLSTEKLIPALAIVGGITLSMVWVFAHYFYSWIALCKNHEVKLRMIEAGHSADDIERVVRAGNEEENDECSKPRPARKAMNVPPAKPIPQHVA